MDDVLNLGIRPDVAIQRARARLEESGGVVFEGTGVSGIDVYSNGAVLDTDKGAVHSRLVIDCMGHASPAVRQARAGQRPDGICIVVGTCAKVCGWRARTAKRNSFFFSAAGLTVVHYTIHSQGLWYGVAAE